MAGQRPSSGSFGDIMLWFIRGHYVLVPSGTLCSGSFRDIMFRFLRGHYDSGIGRTSDVHRGNFLGGSRPPYDDLYSVMF